MLKLRTVGMLRLRMVGMLRLRVVGALLRIFCYMARVFQYNPDGKH